MVDIDAKTIVIDAFKELNFDNIKRNKEEMTAYLDKLKGLVGDLSPKSFEFDKEDKHGRVIVVTLPSDGNIKEFKETYAAYLAKIKKTPGCKDVFKQLKFLVWVKKGKEGKSICITNDETRGLFVAGKVDHKDIENKNNDDDGCIIF